MRWATWVWMIALPFGGCGSPSAADSQGSTEPTEKAPAVGVADPEADGRGGSASGTGGTGAGPLGIWDDLMVRPERAEVWFHDQRVMDLGGDGDGKYTLGGWHTRTGASTVVGDTGALIMPQSLGRLVLPLDAGSSRTIEVRARAFRDGRLTIYAGDDTIGHAQVPVDGTWGTAKATIPAGATGEIFLQLRAHKRGPFKGASAGLAVDWVRFVPEGDVDLPDTRPRVDEGGRAWIIPAGFAVSYDVEVPPGARLVGNLQGRGTLSLRSDRGAPTTVSLTEGSFEAPLVAHAGKILRVAFAAGEQAMVLQHPRLVAPAPGRALPEGRARNVVVFLIDTLRSDKLKVYNPKTRVRTPAMDTFAAGAARFVQARTQENWTKPSVATLLSGLYPWEHQATGSEAVLPSSVKLLSERLREGGFFTGAFVTNGYVSDKFGFKQGWNTWRNYIREGRRSQARFVASDVLEWLDKRPSDKPFFLYVHTIDPHVPYIPPDDLLAAYDPDPYDGIVDFQRDRGLLEKIKIGKVRLGARDKKHLEALYDGEITYHDTHMGSILKGLRDRGLGDDTVVVITSDHGEEFFDHDSVGHGHSVWDELLHVPLLIRIPKVTDKGFDVTDSVGLVDVLPTVYDALGMEKPPELSGRSLTETMARGVHTPRVTVSGFMDGWRTVVVGRYKLIHRTADHVAVYDIASDPGETRDLAEGSPIAVRYLRGLLGLALASPAAGAKKETHQKARTPIDAETEAQLRALGYIGTSRPK
ncbi:MAG: sulfatase [Myxococcales bacterium]|nr:sulfatase [Myxococcales bacterium]